MNAEAKEREEEDELLDFAKSLDYDKFISDMEVKIMVEKLRERIMVRLFVMCVHAHYLTLSIFRLSNKKSNKRKSEKSMQKHVLLVARC